jgi:hypothetical protein
VGEWFTAVAERKNKNRKKYKKEETNKDGGNLYRCQV